MCVCIHSRILTRHSDATLRVSGVLLDDLLMAEDPSAPEPPPIPGAREASPHSVHPDGDGEEEEVNQDVVLGLPVAPPADGSMEEDISTRNALNRDKRSVPLLSLSVCVSDSEGGWDRQDVMGSR